MIKKQEDKTVTIQKFRPFFKTVDKQFHEGCEYKWAIAERLLCSVPEYIMIRVKSDGYLTDKDDVMYPLANIISIEWKKVEEKVVVDKFSEWDVFIDPEELDEVQYGSIKK